MKTLIATALLTTLTASSAWADIQLETRAYHSNMRVDAGKVTVESLGEDLETGEFSEDFLNTAGFGIAAIAPLDETVELGLGLSLARYHPTPGNQTDQTSVSGFTRINLAKTDSGRFYVLAGLSSQQLSQELDDNEFINTKINYTPTLNGDLGLGGSIKLGAADLGLEYKYSNTLSRGRGTLKSSFSFPGFDGVEVATVKAKIRGLVLEGQELALTLGLKL